MTNSVSTIINTAFIRQFGIKVRCLVDNSPVYKVFTVQTGKDIRADSICSRLIHSSQQELLVITVCLHVLLIIKGIEDKPTCLVTVIDINGNNEIKLKFSVHNTIHTGGDIRTVLVCKGGFCGLIVMAGYCFLVVIHSGSQGS